MYRDAATGIEALRARFHGHAYDMHSHDDEWLIGVTHHGVQEFFCRGRRQQSTSGRVILIEPGERHDGHSPDPAGFGYSMLYIPRSWIRDAMGGDGHLGFRTTLSEDRTLAATVLGLCDAIFQSDTRLLLEHRQNTLIAHMREHLAVRPDQTGDSCPDLAEKALDYLHAHFDEDISSSELVAATEAENRFQLIRAFKARYGVAPHTRLIEIRLARARSLLRTSASPADVAAYCGFADQSHLTRWFRRAYGLPPGAFARGRTNVQSSH